MVWCRIPVMEKNWSINEQLNASQDRINKKHCSLEICEVWWTLDIRLNATRLSRNHPLVNMVFQQTPTWTGMPQHWAISKPVGDRYEWLTIVYPYFLNLPCNVGVALGTVDYLFYKSELAFQLYIHVSIWEPSLNALLLRSTHCLGGLFWIPYRTILLTQKKQCSTLSSEHKKISVHGWKELHRNINLRNDSIHTLVFPTLSVPL